jgi:hypothetical protein
MKTALQILSIISTGLAVGATWTGQIEHTV